MTRVIMLFCLLIVMAGGAVGATAASPPALSPEVKCSTDIAAMRQQAVADGVTLPSDASTATMICFYPEHAR